MKKKAYKTSQLAGLVLLRVAIGWHFLYEGLIRSSIPTGAALAI